MGSGAEIAIWLLDKTADMAIGVFATFLGVLVLYRVARVPVKFDDRIQVSSRNGRLEHHLRFAPWRRWVRSEIKVTARLRVAVRGRASWIPIPLSTTVYSDARRRAASSPRQLWCTPRLLVEEIDWKRHMPRQMRTPRDRKDLESILRSLNARLVVTVETESHIFGVKHVSVHRYWAEDLRLRT